MGCVGFVNNVQYMPGSRGPVGEQGTTRTYAQRELVEGNYGGEFAGIWYILFSRNVKPLRLQLREEESFV
jgi:hypothetical protein